MRRVPVALPLLLVTTVMGCHPASDSGAANDPLSPPGLGAEASRSNVDFFFGNDFDRDILFTVASLPLPPRRQPGLWRLGPSTGRWRHRESGLHARGLGSRP